MATTTRDDWRAVADGVRVPVDAIIDGQQVGQIAFASTGSFNTWVETTIDVTLPAGSNTIRLANAGANGPNLDRVLVTYDPDAPVVDTTADEGNDLDAAPESPSTPVGELGAVEFRLQGVDADIVTYAYSTNGGTSFNTVTATPDGADRVVTLDLSAFSERIFCF